VQARAAASGRDALVLTTPRRPGAAGSASTEGSTRCGSRRRAPSSRTRTAQRPTKRALGAQSWRARCSEAGAAEGFVRPPRLLPMMRERSALASAAARRVLGWLASAPVGLADDDLSALGGDAGAALAELERLGLVQKRRGAWPGTAPRPPSPRRTGSEEMAVRLPPGSVAGLVARGARAREESGALRRMVRSGGSREATRTACWMSRRPAPAHLAGLCRRGRRGRSPAPRAAGRTPSGRSDAVPGGSRRRALARAGGVERRGDECQRRAGAELDAMCGDVPARIAARCELVAAHAARRSGDRAGQRRHLERAAALTAPPLAAAEIGLAELDGRQALRELGRRRARDLERRRRRRLLYATGLTALDRGCCAAAMTALRGRASGGERRRPPPAWEIHADIACSAILGERPAVADRHLTLAEALLERAGSLRAATVVRANRAVLANDRLDWRAGRELTLTGQEAARRVDDAGTWLF